MRYRTAESFRRALDDRLLRMAGTSGLPLDRLRKHVAFERFLARIEDLTPRSWVLKGGLAINCRLGTYARPSRDVDLAHGEDARGVRRELVAVGEAVTRPDDHFRFQLTVAPTASLAPQDSQLRFRLTTYLADRAYDLATVDVVIEPDLSPVADVLAVPSLLDFADLPPVVMLVTPAEHHLADKVDAYLRGRINTRAESTREKDLADIVILADGDRLQAGRVREAFRRVLRIEGVPLAALPPPPSTWGAPYETLASQLGLDERTVPAAFELARTLLDPVLSGSAPDAACWNPRARAWELPETPPRPAVS
jgi:nucleotidyltransferase AbiEii toxin of type IV toxin-antitoxin system